MKDLFNSLTSLELRVLFFIAFKTYGFNKKEDKISISQFVNNLDSTDSSVRRSLRSLKKKNIIEIRGKPYAVNTYKIIYSVQKWTATLYNILNNLINNISCEIKKEEEQEMKEEENINTPTRNDTRKFKIIQVKYRDRVFILQSQYDSLCKKYTKKVIEDSLDKLNDWKNEKGATVMNDYKALTKWVIDSVLQYGYKKKKESSLLNTYTNLDENMNEFGD